MSNEESVSPPVEADATALAVGVLCDLQDSGFVSEIHADTGTGSIASDSKSVETQPSPEHYAKVNQDIADQKIVFLEQQVAELKAALSNAQKKASAQKCRANGKILLSSTTRVRRKPRN